MSKTQKWKSLPPLQKRILLFLAEKGAATINHVADRTGSQYKATWLAFRSLSKKGYVRKMDVKKFGNREYAKYWISGQGLLKALEIGANPEKVRKHVEAYYGKSQSHALFFDFCKALRDDLPSVFRLFEVEPNGAVKLVSVPIIKESKAFIVFRELCKKYPSIAREALNWLSVALKDVAGVYNNVG
jgi:hypothetical protein